jgi:hypothetical protein
MGLEPETAITDVMANGIPKLFDVEYADYWPFTESILTNYYPPSYSEDIVGAGKWTLDAAYALETLGDVKVALALDMPVLVGMYPSDSFNDLIGADVWSPTATEEPVAANGHAMCIVGYDDNKYGGAIEILNSWSDQWGTGGYIWVTYDDFLRFAAGAYGLERNSDQRFSAGNELFTTDETNTMEVVDGKPVWMSTKDFEFKGKPGESMKIWGGVDASLKKD